MQDDIKTIDEQNKRDTSGIATNENNFSLVSPLLNKTGSDDGAQDRSHALEKIEQGYNVNQDIGNIAAEFQDEIKSITDTAESYSAPEIATGITEENSPSVTLDDVMDDLEDPDLYSKIDDYLDQMSYSRESVNELLDAITSWDLLQVYEKLLIDFAELLTPEELIRLKKDYRKTFDLPLHDGGE